MRVSGLVPHYMSGVSQQPESATLPTQLRSMTNGIIDLVQGVGKRPGTQHVATVTVTTKNVNAFTHVIDRGPSDKWLIYVGYNSGGAEADVRVVNLLTGAAKTASAAITSAAKTYLNNSDARNNLRALTVGNRTYLLNRAKTANRTSTQSSAITNESLVWIRQIIPGAYYRVRIRYSGTDYSGEYQAALSGATYDAETILADIKTDLLAVLPGGAGSWTINYKGTVMSVKRADNATFEISANDSNQARAMTVCPNEVQSFANLPAMAPDGYRAKVRGDLSSDQDDYWVTFESDNTSSTNYLNTGIWSETVAPGTYTTLDATTLPVVMDIDPTTGQYTMDTNSAWSTKASGDATIGAMPSFITKTIQDIFVVENRLGFLSGNGVVLSQSGNFNNFFRQSALLVSDDDPIDVVPSDPSLATLYHAVPYDQGLLLFGENRQYLLTGTPLTPRTVGAKLISAYPCSTTCKPVTLGSSVMFAAPVSAGVTTSDNVYTHLFEFFISDNNGVTGIATDLTAQCPSLWGGDSSPMAVNPTTKMAVVPYSALLASNILRVYQWAEDGGKRILSAPHTWTFATVTNYLLGCHFVGPDLYLVFYRPAVSGTGSQVTIEKMSFGAADTGFKDVLIDQRSYFTSASSTGAGPTSSFTIPAAIGGTISVVPGYDNNTLSFTELTPTSSSGTSVTVSGDYGATSAYVGRAYDFSIQPNDHFVYRPGPTGGQIADDGGRLQISRLNLTYKDTGYLKVAVANDVGNSFEYYVPVTTGASGLTLGSGSIIVPIGAENSAYTLTISSAKPHSVWIVSGQWFGNFTPKGRSV